MPGQVLPYQSSKRPPRWTLRRVMREYFFVVAKNVVGWLFLIASPVLGVALPGPGGLPLFLIGFALVTFPGKRRLTTRLMRGRRFDLSDPIFVGLTTAVAVLLTAGATMWLLFGAFEWVEQQLADYGMGRAVMVPIVLVALLVTWLVLWVGLHVGNWFIGKLPWARRFTRNTLRKIGIRLLPPRPRDGAEGEILDLSDTNRRRLGRAWDFAKPWLVRMAMLSVALGLLTFIAVPLVQSRSAVLAVLRAVDWVTLLVATAALMLYLLSLRPLAWRGLMAALGHRLPRRAAVAIWAISELANYLPANMVPLVTRAYLLRPMGVGARLANDSRRWELILTTASGLAGAGGLMAVAALLPPETRALPTWLLLPVGALLLIGFGAAVVATPFLRHLFNLMAERLDLNPIAGVLQPDAALKMTWGSMPGLVLFGLAGAAVAAEALRLPVTELPLVAAAYLIAWSIGTATWVVPAGLGVRELVFYLLLRAFLPELEGFRGEIERAAALAVAAVLLRVWSVLGESLAALSAAWLPLRRGGLVR
jgi:uncharacterized membrane protein YbhN (UPF0104 family)